MQPYYKCNGKVFKSLSKACMYANKLGDEQNIIAGIEKIYPDDTIHTMQTGNGRAELYYMRGTRGNYAVDLYQKRARKPYTSLSFNNRQEALDYIEEIRKVNAKSA